jgi:hypothetical protein
MHMTGKGLQTTHYGNNVNLKAATYEADVTVNGGKPAVFRFVLSR